MSKFEHTGYIEWQNLPENMQQKFAMDGKVPIRLWHIKEPFVDGVEAAKKLDVLAFVRDRHRDSRDRHTCPDHHVRCSSTRSTLDTFVPLH